jgi:hypothetical protein
MEKNTPLLEEFDSEIKDTRLSLARRLKSVWQTIIIIVYFVK